MVEVIMNVKRLLKELRKCHDDTEIIIFAETEEGYRPFKNISVMLMNKDSFKEELHLDISIHKECKSIHFPNNLTEEKVIKLNDKRKILLEELDEIEKTLGGFVW